MKQMFKRIKLVVAVVAGMLALGALADSSRLITVTAYNRGEDGVVESVDLAFGECEDGFCADLYASYGYDQGSSTSHDSGWDTVVKLSVDAPITSATTEWNFTMPEGWADTIRYLRFFFVQEQEASNSAVGYYAKGMVMCFDAIDNVGEGIDAHDFSATIWKDLVSGAERALKSGSEWRNGDSLGFTSSSANFVFAPNGLGKIWTLQVVASGQDNACFIDNDSDDIWFKWGNNVKFGFRSDVVAPPNFKANETITLVSADTYAGVHKSGSWSKKDHDVGASTSSRGLWVGGTDGGFSSVQRFHSIRVYDRVLTDEEIEDNNAVDDARFYGIGDVPDLPSGGYELVGSSELIVRDRYANLSVVAAPSVTEVSVTPKLRIDGFELDGYEFSVYARINDADPVLVKSGMGWRVDTEIPITGLAPDCDYMLSFFVCSDEGIASPETETVVMHTTPIVVHDGKVIEGGRSIALENYRSGDPAKGRCGSVDLVFGDCDDDFFGYLYVGYGSKSGVDMSEKGWSHWERVTDEPITVETKSYHYQLPEGWMDGIWTMRFYLVCDPSRMPRKGSAKDYYVQDGLVAMWDGVDNAGVGVHDSEATVWKDLVGENDIAFNDRIFFTTNSIACTTGQRADGPDAEALDELGLSTNLTYEIVYKQKSGSCIATVQNQFGRLYIWNSADWTQFADRSANVTRMPYPGNNTIVQNSIAVSGYENITAYLDGVDCGYYVSDEWNGSPKPTIFSEYSMLNTRGAVGEIYSFRIYNRKLTPDEVLHNYNSDRLRFCGSGFATASSATLYAKRSTRGLIFIIF